MSEQELEDLNENEEEGTEEGEESSATFEDVEVYSENGVVVNRRTYLAGTLEGFDTHIKQFETFDALLDAYGKDLMLALVNTKIGQDQALKSRNSIPLFKGADAKAKQADWIKDKLASSDVALISEQEALRYKPGTRIKTASGYLKDLNKAKQEFRDSKSKGVSVDVLSKIRDRITRLNALLNEAFAREAAAAEDEFDLGVEA